MLSDITDYSEEKTACITYHKDCSEWLRKPGAFSFFKMMIYTSQYGTNADLNKKNVNFAKQKKKYIFSIPLKRCSQKAHSGVNQGMLHT